MAIIPDYNTCLSILARAKTPADTAEHSKKVAKLGASLAESWNRRNSGGLDIPLIYAGGLLHDVCRSEKHHDTAGGALLRELGYPEIAAMAENHMTLSEDLSNSVNETSVLYLADKLVKGRDIVSLETRFEKMHSFKAAGNIEAYQNASKRYNDAKKLYNMVIPPTAGLIVAAGMSSRMGAFKPMLEIGGESMIRRIIKTFRQAGAGEVVVVTGNKSELLKEHIKDMNVTTIYNKDYEKSDMFSSVALGLGALKGKCEQVLFTPVDIPLFKTDSAVRLVVSQKELAVPVHGEKKGHPILINSRFIDEIVSYNGENGLKGAIAGLGQPMAKIAVNDIGVLKDADTPEDHDLLKQIYSCEK